MKTETHEGERKTLVLRREQLPRNLLSLLSENLSAVRSVRPAGAVNEEDRRRLEMRRIISNALIILYTGRFAVASPIPSRPPKLLLLLPSGVL